jgi:hypothetical protein
MAIFHRLYLSALVISRALLPPGPEGGRPSGTAGTKRIAPSPGYIVVAARDVSFYLADLDRAVDRQGELTLFFPGCLAVAAPFLLFRLKRTGFSNCSAVTTKDGLLLTATR